MTMEISAQSPVLRCFVVGPIGSKFAPIGSPAREVYEEALEVFERVILPACQMHSIEPVRADQIAVTGEITDQVFRHLYEDEIVIADVSGGNPNVMYELGLRHTRPLLTIQIGEFGQLPFDLSAVRTIQFSRSDRGLIDARKELERALAAGIAEPGDSLTATRIWNEPSADFEDESAQATAAEPDAEEEDDLDAEGFMDRMVAMENAFPRLTATAESIGEVVEGLGAIAVDSSANMNLANSAGAPATQRLTLVSKFASAIQPSADDLTRLTNGFLADMTEIDSQLTGLFEYLEENPVVSETADIDSFLLSIGGMTRSAREAMEGINQFGSAMDGLAGMSKLLRRPVRQISEAVRTMAKGMSLTDTWEDHALRLRQQRAAKQHLSDGDATLPE
jgi:hypothetical protein